MEPKNQIKPLSMSIINKSSDYSSLTHLKKNGIVIDKPIKQPPISSKAKVMI